MNDWLHNLPIVWMALLVFGLKALGATAIYVVVMALSVGERARSFKAVSPGLLSPLGILFALFIAFTATQVWSDNDKANSVVDREASALRSVVILAAAFPGESESRLRNLIRSYIADAAAQEWPMMAHRTATLQVIPYSLAEALQLVLSLTPSGQGQQTAQREITTSLENAWDARRQRIIMSHSEVNWVKWLCLSLQAACALIAIAMVHNDNRARTGVAVRFGSTVNGAIVHGGTIRATNHGILIDDTSEVLANKTAIDIKGGSLTGGIANFGVISWGRCI
jgi:hypothetical protein